MKSHIGAILLSFLISGFWFPSSGYAACFSPAGNAGDVIYYGGYQADAYCDGGAWISMGGPVGNTTNGLVGWWKLDDGSGTSAADSSGKGNTGTLTNTPTWTTSGMNGGALTLNGTNQYVSVPDVASLELSGSWTVSIWVNFAALPASGTQSSLLNKSGTGKVNYILTLDHGWWGGALAWYLISQDISGGWLIAYAPASVNLGTWYHLAGVYDSSSKNEYLYLNANLIATKNVGASNPTGGPGTNLFLGMDTGSAGSDVNGTIDDARVYNRALSATDIKTLYTSTGPWSGDINTGLTGYWKFDEGSGTSALDSTGNGNTGTTYNAPAWTTSGKINGALQFTNSSSQYVDVANPANFAFERTQPFSFSAWVYNTYAGGVSYISGKQNSTGNFPGWYVEVDPVNHLILMDLTGTTGGCGTDCITVKTPVSSFSSNTWHHVGITYDGTSTAAGTKIYIDGVQQTLTVLNNGLASSILSSFDVTIGRTPASGAYFGGTLDEVRIYNRALSASDMLTLYNTTATACASPAGYTGDFIYNSASHVYQFCNASNWIPMGPVPGAGGSGCTSPTGSEANILYNADNHVTQYCDGANWVAAGENVPISGLVGWWNFDEGSGTTAADSSGNGNTGTLVNSPAWVTGHDNNALNFNGTNTYITMGNVTALNGLGAITVSAWMKSSAAGANAGEKHIVDKSDCAGDSNGGPFELGVSFFSSEKATFVVIAPGGGFVSFSGTSNVDDGQWHLLTGTYDGSYVSIWVDGALQNTSGFSGALASTANPVDIGGYCDGNGLGGLIWSGLIDDVRIYNRALSASEVYRLYNGAP